jgi:tRNA dimethylallyltransferase
MRSAKRWAIIGPTASGKSDIALYLAEHLPIEIVSVDSMMIYRDMDIGTAKPTPEERKAVPHHLIDILDPTQAYSCAQFCEDVHNICSDIESRGRIPVLVGGTMMYFRSLEQGLSSALPKTDMVIRKELLACMETHGLEHMYALLKKVDIESTRYIHANDTQRILRALEVYRMTGKPMSVLRNQPLRHPEPSEGSPRIEQEYIMLMPRDRKWLHTRIEDRLRLMLNTGLVDETISILRKYQLPMDAQVFQSVGYKQVIQYLKKDLDWDALSERATIATRQLAKRQMTWLRSWSRGHLFYCDDKSVYNQVLNFIQRTLHA